MNNNEEFDYAMSRLNVDEPGVTNRTYTTPDGKRIYFLVKGELTCLYAKRDINFNNQSDIDLLEIHEHIQELQNS